MRNTYTVVLIVSLAVTCALVNAMPVSVSADGALDEWMKVDGALVDDHGEPGTGISPQPWEGFVALWEAKDNTSPGYESDPIDLSIHKKNGPGAGYTEDDNTYSYGWTGGNNVAGGEFYDIEALYVDFEFSSDRTQITALNWALVTSWNGDPDDSRITAWNEGSIADRFWQPFIAVDVGQSPNAATSSPYTGWDYGLVLADDSDFSATTANGLKGTVTSYGTNYTARLYDTSDVAWWGAPSPQGYKQGPYAFDRAHTDVDEVASASSQYFGLAYEGSAGDGATGASPYIESNSNPEQLPGWPVDGLGGDHYQDTNWCWEGSMDLSSDPITGFSASGWRIFYTMHCSNDTLWDVATNAPIPEPASVCLLALAVTGAIAGVRRRKR